MITRTRSTGQVLVLFTLFLLVLLGVSALAVDYASWLLTDRALQNVSDHAALAGASQFEQRETQGTCAGGSSAKCVTARIQAWASINHELGLGLSDSTVACLGSEGAFLGDSPAVGETNSARASSGTCTSDGPVEFGHRIWVTTPPPDYAAYDEVGGQYQHNFGVIFVRVDRNVTSFLGGAIGISPDPRHGWATAGALPTDFALQIFCRDSDPNYGNCRNDGLALAGGGNGDSGIRLIRGDIGSNESLDTTSQQNRGVMVEAGNVFLVNGACANNTWNCPETPATTGGIADADPIANPTTANMKNAFYIPPLPVTRFASPIDANTANAADCSDANATNLCVPFRDQTSSNPGQPGLWECGSSAPVACGLPTVDTNLGTVTCAGVNGGSPELHYYVTGYNGSISATPSQSPPSNRWRNLSPLDNLLTNVDNFLTSGNDTLATPTVTSDDFVYIDDLDVKGNDPTPSQSFTVTLGAAGNRLGGSSTVRYTAFKTDGGVRSNTQNPVTLQVALIDGAGTTIVADPDIRNLTDVPQRWEFNVGSGLILNYNSLQLRFTFSSSGSETGANERGGAIAWAGIEHPNPQPPTPPMIPPGYYQAIEVEAGGCAVLDPTAEYSSLKDFQMPGIYRFGADEGGGISESEIHLKLNADAYLIGDGVTLVFDPPCPQVSGSTRCFPDSGSAKGVALAADSGLVLNTARTPGAPPCTPTETETLTINYSAPLSLLPYSAVCAAWAIDPSITVGIRPGANSWARCNLSSPDSGSHCTERANYNPTTSWRGVTLFFTPDGWPGDDISNRFEMQGGDSGLAFRGILYAPYDDVAISGKNGFTTVGQVLAWTAKFHGGGAFIDLDYPYEYIDAKPYLLEPRVGG